MATNPNNLPATQERGRTSIAVMNESEKFSLMQRKAALFARSPLIPDHLRKGGDEVAISNCYIGLVLAEEMHENPLIILQNMHIVNGKAGFSSQYMIARANGSGLFSDPIDWEITGEGDALSVTAFATVAKTGRKISVNVDMAMAIAEGWTRNTKYKSMPKVMLRYRSAAFLVRLYAPQVMLGYHTVEEMEDITLPGPDLHAQPLTMAALIAQADPDTGEIIDVVAEPSPSQPSETSPQAGVAQQSVESEATDNAPTETLYDNEAGGEEMPPLSSLTLAFEDAIKGAQTEGALIDVWNSEKALRKRLKDEAPELLAAVTKARDTRNAALAAASDGDLSY